MQPLQDILRLTDRLDPLLQRIDVLLLLRFREASLDDDVLMEKAQKQCQLVYSTQLEYELTGRDPCLVSKVSDALFCSTEGRQEGPKVELQTLARAWSRGD